MTRPLKQHALSNRCESCSSQLLQVTDWIRLDDEHWQICMRCPECLHIEQLILDDVEVSRLSYHVEDCFQQLLDALEELEQEDFELTCHLFIQAIQANGIYPMDFGSPAANRGGGVASGRASEVHGVDAVGLDGLDEQM